MSMDNVQLKQEEFLGDDVVLSDINPKTNTNSIEDPATGEQLNLTLQQIWNAINNRLNRIVNSVNGRTGVVVLTSDDVGLGNVDNISFTDMKQWIIDLIEQNFRDKKLNLYSDFSQVLSVIESNDRSFAWAPFFCDIFDSDEKRSVIGFYKWDESTGLLGYEYALVNTIGYTDKSILYNRSVNGKDMRGGGLAVNIHRDEEALQLVEGQTWEDSGLMIDSSKVRGTVYAFPCLYGKYNRTNPDSPDRTTALFELRNSGADSRKITVFINDYEVSTPFWLETTTPMGVIPQHDIQVGDIILTNFAWYGPDENYLHQYASTAIMGRQPGYGIVTSAPNRFSPDAPYVIKFYTRQVRASYGLQYIANHMTSVGELHDTELAVSLLTYDFGLGIGPLNISALNAPQPFDKAYPLDPTTDTSSRRPACTLSIELPWAAAESEWPTNFGSGLAITTDYSICTLPLHVTKPAGEPYIDYDLQHYADDPEDPGHGDLSKTTGMIAYRGSRKFKNYSTPTMGFDVTSETLEEENRDRQSIENLRLGSKALLSVKTQKMLQVATDPLPADATTNKIDVQYNAYDISGLRIGTYYDEAVNDLRVDPSLVDPLHNTQTFNKKLKYRLGIYDNKDAVGNPITMPNFAALSGGLQINVGKFLEICPKETTDSAHFNDGGKVQVRIGRGLKEDTWYQFESAGTPVPYQINEDIDDFYYSLDDGETYEPIPWMYFELTEEPDLWENSYTCYYTRIPDPEHAGEYIYTQVPERTIPPTWESGTYFVYRPLAIHETYAHLRTLDPTCEPKFYHKSTSNRITLDVDEETLGFNEDGQLTVVGGGGKGSNVRFTDLRGFYFDTVETEDPTHPVPVDEIVVVGRGLCIRGGKVPSDIFTNTKRLRTYLSDMLDMYILNYVTEFSKMYIDDFAGSPLASITEGAAGSYDSFRTTVKTCTVLSDLQTYYDRFERAMLSADAYIKSVPDSYLYLMGSIDDVRDRIADLMDGVNAMSTENKNALLALLRAHYSLGESITTTDQMFNALINTVNVIESVSDPEPGWTYPLTWLFNEFVQYVLDPSTIPLEYFESTEEETPDENEPGEEET